jgi:uncharacterized membrane protein YeaQ/YmgE (transglycosylase-associated protein family)
VITYIIGLVISGLIVGGLGRLAVPGPNPMTIGKTILIGIGGSFVGGFVGYLLFGRGGGGLLLSVLAAAGIVYFLERREVTS